MVAFSLNDRIDDGKTGADDHPRQCRARQCLGHVGQDAALDKNLTGREMLHLHGAPYRLSRDSTQRRVVELDAPAVLEAPYGSVTMGACLLVLAGLAGLLFLSISPLLRRKLG
ncbi:MAG: hypothetical protein F4226_08445 [Synechococcus sp. SB0678_bin_12]|nr:hypothetical protein [Synechococcus sp. SB0678_bin_12]MYI87169.1 hypothetical protein [Synechococcus sp. SB0672_bin_10]